MRKLNDKNISFVISTNRERVYTLESIPADCPVYVEREGSLNQAKNRGIRKADIVIAYDDIKF